MGKRSRRKRVRRQPGTFKRHGQEKPMSSGVGPAPLALREYNLRIRSMQNASKTVPVTRLNLENWRKMRFADAVDIPEKVKAIFRWEDELRKKLGAKTLITKVFSSKTMVDTLFTDSRTLQSFFLREDYVTYFFKKSLTYRSPTRAMEVYNQDGVRWLEMHSLEEALLIPPD